MVKVPFDADKLKIVNDPLPPGRVRHGKKYDLLFSKLKPGSAVRVQSEDVQRISNALRDHIASKGLNAHVRSVLHYPGDPQDFGRVWMMPGPQTVPCSGYRKGGVKLSQGGVKS